jgi:hypothetical protein
MDGPGFHVGGLCPTWALSPAAGPRLARTRAPVGAIKVSRILRRHQLGRSLADTTRCPVGSWARPQPVPYTIAQEAIEVMICDFTLSMTSTFISLTELAHRAPEIVPDLAWVSVGRIPKGLTFTLVATAAEIAVLDGIQYLAGGPALVQKARARRGPIQTRSASSTATMCWTEEGWRLFAEPTEASAVHSTLTLAGGDRGPGGGNSQPVRRIPGAFVGQRRPFLHHAQVGPGGSSARPGATLH